MFNISKLRLRENISRLLWKGLTWLNTRRNPLGGEDAFLRDFLPKIHSTGNDPLTFIDCGANIGFYTDLLLKYAKNLNRNFQVHIFEPQKACCEQLQEKYSLNQNVLINSFAVCKNERIDLLNKWCGNTDSWASFYDRSSILEREKIPSDAEKVQTVRLDTYIKDHSLSHIHLLKLDIEGNEMNALEGLGDYLNSRFIDCIQFEYGNYNLITQIPLKSFFELLTEKNFILFKILTKGPVHMRYKPWLEDYRHSNYIAVAKKLL